MEKIKKALYIAIILFSIIGCEAEQEICAKGDEAAILYYTPNCATINGYITLIGSGETLVFQHEIDEKFQKTGIEICLTYNREEPVPLTAECFQGDLITITSIQER